ncbi:NnrS family protein [Pelagibius sp. Alg239-R121]|uniref:NnrS family protein n=1 Tax=Pelagibius sp. Alg239-R121 TaxID=2993448 RepID=UPI0024A6C452|nr:NnrS family protein [Pelagibius sp. Alg239-R121]
MTMAGTERQGLSIPLLEMGFRPFYLLAALSAGLAVPLWLANFAGLLQGGSYLTGATWHSHEMLFGFAAAVITGFLFTAAANWSGRRTPRGAVLAGFAVLWLLGRVLVVTGPGLLAAIVDVLFLPLAALAVAIPLLRSGNRRNLFVVAILLLLGTANALFHLEQLFPSQALDLGAFAVRLSVDVIAILMAVIGGRIIPVFTANAVPDARPVRLMPIESLAILSLLAIAVVDVLEPWRPIGETLLAVLLCFAALLHGLRVLLWAPWSTRREPLLWILPLSYAWIPIALALRGASLVFEEVPPLLSLHAMTVGAMGGLMLAMMMRSSRGHTGRALSASGPETLALVLVPLAAVTRVFPALFWPEASLTFLTISAVCWSASFLIFFGLYWPILTRPRADAGTA